MAVDDRMLRQLFRSFIRLEHFECVSLLSVVYGLRLYANGDRSLTPQVILQMRQLTTLTDSIIGLHQEVPPAVNQRQIVEQAIRAVLRELPLAQPKSPARHQVCGENQANAVEARILRPSCGPSCGCVCHKQSRFRSPRFLDHVLGSLVMGYKILL